MKDMDIIQEMHKARMAQALNEMRVRFDMQANIREWAWMMQRGDVNTNDVLRVEVNDDGTVNLYDFTLPSKGGRKRLNVHQDDVEKWIMETISMLRITDENDLIPNLGFKVSDTLYYILNREGEMK